MRAAAPASPDLRFWREAELGGACLLRARYEAHEFTRRPNLVRAGPEAAKMRVVRDCMAANYEHGIGNRELASLAGLSRYHFVGSFRRAFGMPPHAYLNQMRLLAAKRLLKEGRSPGEAAAAVGFFDQSYLTRVFKRAYGITPAVYAVPARDRFAGRAPGQTSPSGGGVS